MYRLNTYIPGLVLVFFIVLLSYYLAQTPYILSIHLSPLIIAIIFGACLSNFYAKAKTSFANGVDFSAKKLLRFGIILYGFNVSLLDIKSIGLSAIILSLIVVVSILIIGIYLGVKYMKMDKELAFLVSAGSAICGAAAILALESALKSKSDKTIVALATVVIFGLLSMILYPLLYFAGFFPFSAEKMGIYIGLSLHEVANVVAAASAISDNSATYAVIIKMIRVILLVPVLFILPLFINTKEKKHTKLHIPYFALGFLAVICLHSFFVLPQMFINYCKILSVLSLSAAMGALGLNIHLKSFSNLGKEAFILAFLLFVLLFIMGFLLVYIINF